MKKTKPGKRATKRLGGAGSTGEEGQTSGDSPEGGAEGTAEPRLPAFRDLSWTLSGSAADLDETLRAQPAGIDALQVRIHHPTTRSNPLTFSRVHKGARKLTVGAVLDRIEDFYREIVPPGEAEVLARLGQTGELADPDEYLAEHLFPDPAGPLRMLPPDEHGNRRPSWTTSRARVLLQLYSSELSPSASAGEVWEGIASLLASYEARKEPFPVFPPRTKAPCERLSLMGGLVYFEGLAVLGGPTEGISFTPEPGVLDLRVLLGS